MFGAEYGCRPHAAGLEDQGTTVIRILHMAGRGEFESPRRESRPNALAERPLKPLEYLPKLLFGRRGRIRTYSPKGNGFWS